MTPIEELTQARDTLQAMMDAATPGRWRLDGKYGGILGGPLAYEWAVHERPEPNADLIVASVNLGPVVLAILNDAIDSVGSFVNPEHAFRDDALRLARGINGEAASA